MSIFVQCNNFVLNLNFLNILAYPGYAIFTTLERGTCGCLDYERENDHVGRPVIVESDQEVEEVPEVSERPKPRRQTPTRKCKK